MFEIITPKTEYFNDETQEFVVIESVRLEMEHSLVSLSKWESKWEVPFLNSRMLTDEQTLDYIRCMVVTPDVPSEVYELLNDSHLTQVNDYVSAKMTATWFSDTKQSKGDKEVITSELIYYWMISLSIPFECQYWHLSRLLTLIRVCNEKNQPSKKMGKADLASRNRALNAQRRAKMNTKG